MRPKGRGFRVFISFLLLGIFVELFLIIGILSDDDQRNGDVAVVEVKGPIMESMETVRDLKKYANRDHVKAIVLRVDSPGGAVGASQEIHDEVIRTKKKKPVVVSMGNVAASGGYYISAPASQIIALPGSITGSLGVIMQFFVLEDLLKKAYLRWEVIKSGDVKDIGSPLHGLGDEERKILQTMSDDVHEQFIEAVASGRGLKVEEARKLADGRIFSGRSAKKVGLVDALGGLEMAITTAGKLAGIKGTPTPIYPEEDRFPMLSRLVEGKFETQKLSLEYRMNP